jgi:hypothetical protein
MFAKPAIQNCTKYDLFRSALCPARLPAFRKQVIHISTHSKWGQLWNACKLSPQKLKKIRDLFRRRDFFATCSFIDQTSEARVKRGFQQMANTLYTEAPTDFGGNFGSFVENLRKPRKIRVCP